MSSLYGESTARVVVRTDNRRVIVSDGSGATPLPDTTVVSQVLGRGGFDYLVEIEIEWPSWVTPSAGRILRLDVAVAEDDNSDNNIEGRIAWNNAVVERMYPADRFGLIRLDGPDSPSDDLICPPGSHLTTRLCALPGCGFCEPDIWADEQIYLSP